MTIATDDNAFRPECKCMSGFKTSTPRFENILYDENDTCVLCPAAECGDRPTSSPTTRPTISESPSTIPTLSVFPTSGPTISVQPSVSPTTGSPSLRPTVSHIPSSKPSSSPSTYGTIYDGDYCRFDTECSTFSCVNNTCHGKVSRCHPDIILCFDLFFLTHFLPLFLRLYR